MAPAPPAVRAPASPAGDSAVLEARPIESDASGRALPLPAVEVSGVGATAIETAEAAEPEEIAVYSATDADVTPPMLQRQQLPSEPTSSGGSAGSGVLEIIVSETGEVEHVRLVSPDSLFQERMLIAAVKAWRFHPALGDGRPVKYRLLMRLTR